MAEQTPLSLAGFMFDALTLYLVSSRV